jgi:hypothetical protein
MFGYHSRQTFTVELGLVIGKAGRDISVANAESHIAGYGMSFVHSFGLAFDCSLQPWQ